MISTIVYNNIFHGNTHGQSIAASYARTGQGDIGLEWLGKLSMRLATAMAYLRVHTSGEDACLFLNESIDNFLLELSSTNIFCDKDSDEVTVETIQALYFIYESIPGAEDLLLNNIYTEIQTTEPAADAVALVPLSSI